jgi:transposase
MGRAYSMDLRKRAMDLIAAGVSERRVAQQLAVSRQWVQLLKKRNKNTGTCQAKELKGHVGRKRKLKSYQEHKSYQEQLKQFVKEQPDATQAELAVMMRPYVKVNAAMIWRELKILKLTYKKNTLCRRTRPTRCHTKSSRIESQASGFEPEKTSVFR